MDLVGLPQYDSPTLRWRAITQRDALAHWSFIYGVTSTRIYCRPTCKARVARRVNVVFFDTVDQARAEGYRPCQRCKPDDGDFVSERDQVVSRAIDLLRARNGATLARGGMKDIAKEIGITPSYLCRAFKRTMGITISRYFEEFEKVPAPEHYSGDASSCSYLANLTTAYPRGVDGTLPRIDLMSELYILDNICGHGRSQTCIPPRAAHNVEISGHAFARTLGEPTMSELKDNALIFSTDGLHASNGLLQAPFCGLSSVNLIAETWEAGMDFHDFNNAQPYMCANLS